MADINFSVALTGLAQAQSGIASISATFNGVSSSAQSFGSRMREIGNSISDFGRSAQSVGRTLSGFVTAPILAVAGAAIKLSSDFEQARIAFTTMLGSAREGDRFLRQLAAFAKSTPFQFTELQEAAKRMMALGFESKQVLPALRIIGDAVAGLGSGAEGINRITLALGQMQAKGKVTAEEMRQLAEAGIPAWDILAKKIGVSIPEAMEMVRKRMIDSSVAIPAILEGMNERFGGLMAKQAQTIGGIWSNLIDSMKLNLVIFGNDLVRIFDLKGVLNQVIAFSDQVTTAWGRMDDSTKRVILTVAGLSAALGPAVVGLGLLAQTVGFAVAGLGLLLGAITPLTIAVVALGAAWVAFGTPLRDINSMISGTVAEFRFFQGVIQEVIGGVVAVSAAMLQWASTIGGSLLQALQGAGQAILRFFGDLPQMAVNGLNTLTAFVIGVFQNLGGRISQSMSGWSGAIRSSLGGIGNVFAQVFGGILTLVSTFITRIREWMVGRLTSIMDSVKGTLEKVKGYFQELYQDVVGSSIIPDMVREIGEWMGVRLKGEMEGGSRAAVEAARMQFERFFGQMRSGFEVLSDNLGTTLQFSQRTIAERLGEIVVEGGRFKDAFTGIWEEIKKSVVASIVEMGFEWGKRALFKTMIADMAAAQSKASAMSAGMQASNASAASSFGGVGIAAAKVGLAIAAAAVTAKAAMLAMEGGWKNLGLAFLLSPIGAQIGLFISAIQRMRGAFSSAFDAIRSGLSAVGSFFSRIFSQIGSAASAIGGAMRSAFSAAFNAITAAARSFGSAFTSVLRGVQSAAISIVNAIRSGFQAAFNAITSAARAFGSAFTSVLRGVQSAAVSIMNAIRSGFIAAFNAITSAARSFGSTFLSVLRGIQSAAISIINAMRSAFQAAFNAIASAARAFVGSFASALRGLIGVAQSVAGGILSAFRGAFSSIASAASSMASSVAGTLSGLLGRARDVVGSIGGIISGGISSAVGAARGAIGGIADAARDVVGGIADGIRSLNPFAEGGVVTRPTAALIGEAGEPEAVIPLSRAKEFGFGGGREVRIVVNLYGPNLFDELTYQNFVRRLSSDLKREAMRFA